MALLPAVAKLVVQVGAPVGFTCRLAQPGMPTPSARKCTKPKGTGEPSPVTVAVNVTGALTRTGDPLVATATEDTAIVVNLRIWTSGLLPTALREAITHCHVMPFGKPVTTMGDAAAVTTRKP